MNFEIKDPAYSEKILKSWEKQAFMKALGVEVEEIKPGFMQLGMEIRQEHEQSHGYVSGSVIGALADVAGGYAAYSVTEPGVTMLTVEYKVNFLSPAHGERLIARGNLEKAGSTISVAKADVFSVKAGEEKRVALATMTMITLPEVE